MKNQCLFAVIAFTFIAAFAGAAGFDHSHAALAKVLQRAVKSGRVDYATLKQHPQDLDDYLHQTAAVSGPDFQGWSEPQQLAFLINVYNAQTLHLIVDSYPLQSIRDIQHGVRGPWDMPVVHLFGSITSLNHLENNIIRKRYKEPRIHFALVCAARGCPPLLSEPYEASKLERQLREQTTRFMQDHEKNFVRESDKTIQLSPIFQWYEMDFVSVAGSIQSFVAPFMEIEMPIEKYAIRYTYYDWALNDAGKD